MLLEFRSHWTSIEADFGGTHELSGTNVNRLWDGVTFVMQARAAPATVSGWGCPEVELACKEQYEAIPAYRAAVAASVARAASVLARDAAISVNLAYLSFFFPFWWEHVLLRSRLEDAEAARITKEILSRPPPPPYVPPAPPPVPAAPRPQARQPAPPPGQGSRPTGPFLGKPISPLIVGSNIGLNIPSYTKGCLCAVSTAYPGRIHRAFECPIKYHATLGACPGWTAAGVKIPACWNGDDLTDACRAEWRTFVQVLPCSNMAQGTEVSF